MTARNFDWFKISHDMEQDGRIVSLTDPEFRLYIMLQAASSKAAQRGTLPAEPIATLAARLRTTAARLKGALERCAELQLLSVNPDGSIVMTEFIRQQYQYPSDQPQAVNARVTKSRALQAVAAVPGNDTVTSVKRVVTSPNRAETTQEGGERDLDPDSDGSDLKGEPVLTTPAPAPSRVKDEFDAIMRTVPRPEDVAEAMWIWWVQVVVRRAVHRGFAARCVLLPPDGIDLGDEIAAWEEKPVETRPELKGWLRTKLRFWVQDHPAQIAPLNQPQRPPVYTVDRDPVADQWEWPPPDEEDAAEDSPDLDPAEAEPTENYSPYIAAVIADYSRELDDGANTAGNVNRAVRLWTSSGLDEDHFVDLCHTAKREARKRQGQRGAPRKIVLFFQALRAAVAAEAERAPP